MNHTCVYCHKVSTPKGCKCGVGITGLTYTCELPESICCESSECNLRFQLDSYKLRLEEAHGEVSKLKALNNQFRTICIGPKSMEQLVNDGTVDTSTIRLFVAKQRASIDQISVETCLVFMEFYQKMSEMFA